MNEDMGSVPKVEVSNRGKVWVGMSSQWVNMLKSCTRLPGYVLVVKVQHPGFTVWGARL